MTDCRVCIIILWKRASYLCSVRTLSVAITGNVGGSLTVTNNELTDDILTFTDSGTQSFNYKIPSGDTYFVVMDDSGLTSSACALTSSASGTASVDTTLTIECTGMCFFLIKQDNPLNTLQTIGFLESKKHFGTKTHFTFSNLKPFFFFNDFVSFPDKYPFWLKWWCLFLVSKSYFF